MIAFLNAVHLGSFKEVLVMTGNDVIRWLKSMASGSEKIKPADIICIGETDKISTLISLHGYIGFSKDCKKRYSQLLLVSP